MRCESSGAFRRSISRFRCFSLLFQGALRSTTYPDGSTVASTFDAAGQIISSSDERGNITGYTYDAVGRLTAVTDALLDATGREISRKRVDPELA